MLVLTIETVVTICIMFHHTNTSFRHEQLLGRVMIVPFLHRLHHSTERSEHDRNYGAIFSVWDKLFGTLSEAEPKHLGIKGKSPQDLFNLLKFGFVWEIPAQVQPANLNVMIAEAAYYKAEKRNFHPGDDLHDWLEAKRDIVDLYGKKPHPVLAVADYCKALLVNLQQLPSQQSLKDLMQISFESR
jgi:Fatty acid hydroxylase superfamily/Protein of unknown function (DUF2934)